MSEALWRLNENLIQQVELFKELLTHERDKRKALVENNLQGIESTTVQEEGFIIKVNCLEKERLLWAEEIGREIGKKPEDLTLAELANYYPALVGVSRDLDQLVGELQEIRKINSILLQRAMKIVDYTLELLTYQESNAYTYPAQKVMEENKKRHLMEWRV